MRNTFAILISLCLCLSVNAQKDKAKFASFNTRNDVIVAFKSGTVALYSNPDLELIKEVTPKDKKNNAATVGMSTTGKYVIVYDSKVKAWVVYDSEDLSEVARLENKVYGLPQFVGPDQILKDKQIISFPDLSVIVDISNHNAKHEGVAFSPSQSYYINYEMDGTGGDGEFEVFETATGKSLGNSKIGESSTQSNYIITDKTSFIDENLIKIVYREHLGTDDYEWIVPVKLGVDNFSLNRELTEFSQKDKVEFLHQELVIASGEYAVDANDDYSLYGMNASQNRSMRNDFIVISTPKNKINLYKNEKEETEMIGDFKKSILLKSITIPAEK